MIGIQGRAKEYKSDLSKVPSRILERKMIPVFHLDVNLVEERFGTVYYVEAGKKLVNCDMTIIRNVISGYWSTSLRILLSSFMRTVPVDVMC